MTIPTIRVQQGWLDGTIVSVGPVNTMIVLWDGGFERIVFDTEVTVLSGRDVASYGEGEWMCPVCKRIIANCRCLYCRREHIAPLRATQRAKATAAIAKANRR
jgi:hypothetical protein